MNDPSVRMSVIVEERDGLDISMSGLTSVAPNSKQISSRKRNEIVFGGSNNAHGKGSNKLSNAIN